MEYRKCLTCVGGNSKGDWGLFFYHDGRVPVAEHIAAHLQQTPPEVVAVVVQGGDLARAAVGAVLAADHAQRADDLLRGRRRHARRVEVAGRPRPQCVYHIPAAKYRSCETSRWHANFKIYL